MRFHAKMQRSFMQLVHAKSQRNFTQSRKGVSCKAAKKEGGAFILLLLFFSNTYLNDMRLLHFIAAWCTNSTRVRRNGSYIVK